MFYSKSLAKIVVLINIISTTIFDKKMSKTIELGANHKFCFFLNSVVLDEAKGLVKSDDAGNRLGVYK